MPSLESLEQRLLLAGINPVILALGAAPDPVDRGVAVVLTATGVTDADGTIASVSFYRDVNANGTFEAGTDVLMGVDADGTNGWSLSVATGSFSLGANTFFAVATDNDANLSNAVITIVTLTNTAPVAVNDDYGVDEDNTLTVDTANGVLFNDTDINADDLTAELVDGPGNAASFTLNADGSFTYVPNADFNGQDSFTYKANDGTTTGNTATVSITVNALNDAPLIADQGLDVDENSADATVVGTVVASDVDDGDVLTYAITAGNEDGVFAIDDASGQITVADGSQLNHEQTASYALTVSVTDVDSLSDIATVTIDVNDLNEAPAIADQGLDVDENVADDTVVGTVVASDVDDGDVLTYAITAGNEDGVFAIDDASGQITVADGSQLNHEQTASYALTVSVTDVDGLSDSATVTIDVDDLNDASVNTVPDDQAVNEGGSLIFSEAHGNAITIADLDAADGNVEVTLGVGHGTLTLPSTTNLTILDGANGTSEMTISGTLADINAALDGLSYQPGTFSGQTTLSIATNDKGNTGDGGELTDVSLVDLNVNDLPTVGLLGHSHLPVMRTQNLTLTAGVVADTDGTIASVSFYRDVNANGTFEAGTDVLMGVDADGTNGWSWTGSTTAWTLGEQNFLAMATDNLGAVGTPIAGTLDLAPYALTWTRGGPMTVTILDMAGDVDITASNITVRFSKTGVKSITFKGTQPMDGLAIVIDGATSVGRITDKRTGVLGDIAFIASDSPVSRITIKGDVTGWNLNDQSFGGIDFAADVDGDGQTDDLTGVYLAGGLSGTVDVRDLSADAVASQGMKVFQIRGLALDADLRVGAASGTLRLKVAQADGVDVTSGMGISTLTTKKWEDGTITAPSIKTLKVTGDRRAHVAGDLTADILLTAAVASRKTNLATLTVAGTMTGTTIRSAGSLGKITVGAMLDSTIFAGVKDATTGLPQVEADFAAGDLLAGITGLTVKGLPGVANSFGNSNVAAWTLGAVSLKNVLKDTLGGSDKFGLVATSVKSYKRMQDKTTAYKWSRRTSAWPMDDGGDFVFDQISNFV